MAKLQVLAVLAGHTEDRVWHLSWTNSGHFLASCGEDKIIRIWSFQQDNNNNSSNNSNTNVQCISVLEDGQTRTIRCCEWSHDATMIASASFDGTVFVWRTTNAAKTQWEKIGTLEGHDNEVKCVAWNLEDNRLVTCGRDKKIWVWELLAGGEFECISVLEGHTQDVKYISWHPQSSILFSCSYDDTIRVWAAEDDGEDWFCTQVLNGHRSTVWSLTTNDTGHEFLSCSDDQSLCLWKFDGEQYQKLSQKEGVHQGPIYSIDWKHGVCASAGADNNIVLSTVTDHQFVDILATTTAHANDINCVRWNPNPKYSNVLASCGDDGLVKLWNMTL